MRKILLATVLLFCSVSQAQIYINNTLLNPKQLVETVLIQPGSGITPPGIKFNGVMQTNFSPVNDQAAQWNINSNTIPSLGFYANQNGILLTTGNAQVAVGPNNSGTKTQAPALPIEGDVDLAILSGSIIRNVAVLEFDFVATASTLSFDYIFGSEEYPEWVGTAYNDVFGFFLSGPGITGPFSNNAKNIALLPTGEYVMINNVNHFNNTPYYTNNGTGTTPLLNPDVQYDGLTKKLKATSDLQYGGLYHIKFAIANVADTAYDSGLFISNFTNSNPTPQTLKTVTFNADNIQIYPNPASEVINIRLENTMENLESVALYDVLGKSVLKTKNVDSNQTAINVSALSKGVYLVEITTANQLKMTKKLIVK